MTPSNRDGRIKHILTPTGPIAVVAPVAEALFTAGVISGSLTGELHAADAATVKAAIMSHSVCDFCTAPGATHVYPVPDFDMPHGVGVSTEGWAACDTCHELVKDRKKKDVLTRSLAGMAFPKFSKAAIEELHAKFWKGLDQVSDSMLIAMRLKQFIANTLPNDLHGAVPFGRAERADAMVRATGLPLADITALADSEDLADTPMPVLVKLYHWRKQWDKQDPNLLGWMGIRKPAPIQHIPHWQQALDAKFSVAAMLKAALGTQRQEEFFPDAVDLHDKEAVAKIVKAAKARNELRSLGFDHDLKILPLAQAYSFNGETAAAILEAAQSIPHDAPLSSVETPNTGAGWYWFGEPLNVASSPLASEKTQALLWAWVDTPRTGLVEEASPDAVYDQRPALSFSAYVKDEKPEGSREILPSTRWFWPFHLTFHEMLAYNTRMWRRAYGPGSAMEHDPSLMTEQQTLRVIADLSLFFLMSCLWFRQTVPGNAKKKADPVLTQADGHIERHAKKRYQRDFKLGDTPTVRVVALRKSARTEASEAPEDRVAGARSYQCRWIVKGHARLQACGPGRKDRKLIWVDAYVAGPEDKPIRTKTTVFAVVR